MTREEEFNQWLKSQPQHFFEHLTRVDELLIYQNRATARTEDLLQAIAAAGGVTIPSAPINKSLLLLARAQLLSDPERVCALINSHQPNLCKVAGIGWSVAIGAGATTTVSTSVRKGFVWVVTNLDFYTDIPFALQAIITKDNELWYVDAGLVPYSARLLNWSVAKNIWASQLTNTSALTVNAHLAFTGWEVEAETFKKIMAVIGPLSYAIAEHGTPEEATE